MRPDAVQKGNCPRQAFVVCQEIYSCVADHATTWKRYLLVLAPISELCAYYVRLPLRHKSREARLGKIDSAPRCENSAFYRKPVDRANIVSYGVSSVC